MIRVLSGDDLRTVLDLGRLTDVVASGLVKQAHGEVARPERPHYPIGEGLGAAGATGTGLVMPAYIHGAEHFATKLVSIHEGNREAGLPTIHAQIVLAEAGTGRPSAVLEGTLVTNARTGGIGAAAVRALADGPVRLGVLGAGAQARWQTRAIATVADVSDVRIYAPSDSRFACAADLRDAGVDASAVDAPAEAVRDASVVVTATTSETPVFPAAALADDAIVVAIGAYTEAMQELEPAVLEAASAVYADVPEEVAAIGDVRGADIDAAALIPLGALLAGDVSPPTDGPVVVESVGSAVLDAAAAAHLYDEAVARGIGTTLEF